ASVHRRSRPGGGSRALVATGGQVQGCHLRSFARAPGACLCVRVSSWSRDACGAVGVLLHGHIHGSGRSFLLTPVIIDRGHRAWLGVCLAVLAGATVGYMVYSRVSLNGASGGSWVGLTYGAAGYALMLFAGALGLRARRPTWRLGRAETWLRGHVWLA